MKEQNSYNILRFAQSFSTIVTVDLPSAVHCDVIVDMKV